MYRGTEERNEIMSEEIKLEPMEVPGTGGGGFQGLHVKPRITLSPVQFGYQVHLMAVGSVDGNVHGVARPLEFEKLEEGALGPAPSFMMGRKQTQALMDELWYAGLRPSAEKDKEIPVELMAEVGEHIGDLRSERDYLRKLVEKKK